MSKKLILVLVVASFFSGFNFAQADVIINEVMYAPANGSDYEWVEIFNSGSNSIDLNNYRFFHGETNSGPLTLRNGSTTILQPSEFAIIAKSPSVVTDYNWLNFSGMILSASTVSLPDSGDNTYIAISDPDKVILDHVTYDISLGGSKESGNSLQLINGSWVGATPTPGAVNEAGDPPPPPPPDDSNGNGSSGSGGGGGSSSGNSSETKVKAVPLQKIKTQITTGPLAYVGVPFVFQGMAFGTQGEKLFNGRYFWNFGDGDSREVKVINIDKFTHTYFYPGEYTVVFEYYPDSFADTPDASQTITVKVIIPEISISSVGNEKDFFVELENNTGYNADLSNWILASDGKSFKIPRDTILAAKKKTVLSPKITHFSIEDKNTLKLMTSEGDTAFDYSSSSIPPSHQVTVISKNTVSKIIMPASTSASLGGPTPNISIDSSEQIPAENLLASALRDGALQQDGKGTDLSPIIPLASIVFIGAGAGSVYFIRRKKIGSQPGSDFEILDE